MRFHWRALAIGLFMLGSLVAVSAQETPTTMPVLVKNVQPRYTDEARQARIQGNVMLDAIVLKDGTVGEVTVTKSLDKEHGLDDQAVKAIIRETTLENRLLRRIIQVTSSDLNLYTYPQVIDWPILKYRPGPGVAGGK